MTYIFGLKPVKEIADITIIPAEWDITTSYGSGTSNGPNAIKEASPFLDFHHHRFPKLTDLDIRMEIESKEWQKKNTELAILSKNIINKYDNNIILDNQDNENQLKINIEHQNYLNYLEHKLEQCKSPIKLLCGGEHSISLAGIRHHAKQKTRFGILQIDAHMDLRNAYQGFEHSHASVMYNAIQLKEVSSLVQVGIRDYCEEEFQLAESNSKITTFYDQQLKKDLFEVQTWKNSCDTIIKHCPENVYLTCDIDGLDPSLCPGTGTPVPGGLSFDQLLYLIERLIDSGRRIIGCDLVEVAPQSHNDWDGNVGARLLYQLCGYMYLSQLK